MRAKAFKFPAASQTTRHTATLSVAACSRLARTEFSARSSVSVMTVVSQLLRLGLLGDDVFQSVGVNGFRSHHHINGFPEAANLSGFGLEVSEELLIDELSRNAGLVVDLVFGTNLSSSIDQHLDVLKLELGIERAMEKSQKLGDLGWSFEHRGQSDRGEVGQLQRAF